ncbi:alpha/beta hydrolase-fold protein [Zobellia galactanivorans]|uniref:Esterase n=1 Tax=Zobellia galactanivorans (strain DSM 12802 / CCUG 47099 / CIP 106680 / NCIMB 13871 / Dsij) TaxID=63186 RepID=G0L3U7_ZOBGA|nr:MULTISPECIES: alpha/beta hydrolase-fold protein [Zobellia]MDO6808344.1 alpha/beta hydrolase-fold protein [Zobellia galactanivorans]OWW26533.1 esterase [Zobellia sp. OII3]CAZ95470.1 Esterase [Zobellia galactanivorans]
MLRKLTFFAFLLCASLNAQVTQEIFESFKLQERRDVKYYIPEDYDKEKKYPLIVVLDGEYLFDQVVANAKFYNKFHGMPASIIVGIQQGKKSIRLDDCAYEPDTGLPSEKAKNFFEFLGMEMIPFLDLTYSTAPFKMIVGYDITANFTNYWLFKESSLFNAYINISPDLAPEMETRVPARLASFDKQIFYQLIVETEKNENTPRILQMDKAIKAIDKESLHYTFLQYEGADHISIATYGLGKAFDNIFGMFKPISPKEYKTQILTSEDPAFQYLETKYQSIEDLFGFKKTVDLNDIMAIYAACRKKEDVESLKPLADLCKKEFPETMMGFYFEGEYYEQIGEPKKAFKTFEKAFAMDEIDFLTKEMALEKIDALKADFGY